MQLKQIFKKDKNLIQELVNIWERSVKISHKFLTEQEINNIKKYVPEAIINVPFLIVMYDNNKSLGFIGINKNKIEMLFIDDKFIGKGIGSALMSYAFSKYIINEVTVNVENDKAHNFYLKHGFYDYERKKVDEQGNPYPIIIMKKDKEKSCEINF